MRQSAGNSVCPLPIGAQAPTTVTAWRATPARTGSSTTSLRVTSSDGGPTASAPSVGISVVAAPSCRPPPTVLRTPTVTDPASGHRHHRSRSSRSGASSQHDGSRRSPLREWPGLVREVGTQVACPWPPRARTVGGHSARVTVDPVPEQSFFSSDFIRMHTDRARCRLRAGVRLPPRPSRWTPVGGFRGRGVTHTLRWATSRASGRSPRADHHTLSGAPSSEERRTARPRTGPYGAPFPTSPRCRTAWPRSSCATTSR